jgi:hypothetical protein
MISPLFETKSKSESFTIPIYGNPLTPHMALFKWL